MSVIYIGIGTSGLRILEEIQSLCYDNTGENCPPDAKFIVLESDEAAEARRTPLGTDITPVKLQLGSKMENVLDSIRKESATAEAWLPAKQEALEHSPGAGGMRSFGRLLLWRNIENVIQTINAKRAQLQGQMPTVYLAGTLLGGTGSGIFIDLAYIIKHYIPGLEEIYGLLLVPDRIVSVHDDSVKMANCYRALHELAYFNLGNTVYEELWPNGVRARFQEPPFNNVHLISREYDRQINNGGGGGNGIRDLNGLYKMAGLYLYLNMKGLFPKRTESLVDARANLLMQRYSTFGISAVQYPASQIKDYVAAELGKELINSWLDTTFHADGEQRTRTADANIEKAMTQKWADFVGNAFSELDNVGGRSIPGELDNEVLKLDRDEIAGDPADYIYDLFRTGGQFNNLVKNGVQKATDRIVIEIANLCTDLARKTRNLVYVSKALKGLVKSIDSCLDHWNTLGVNAQPADWDNWLHAQSKMVVANTYRHLWERRNVMRDRVERLLEMMKIHLLGRRIREIQTDIDSRKTCRTVTDQDNHSYDMPSVIVIREFMVSLPSLIKKSEGESGKVETSLQARMDHIQAEMEDKSMPILRVYRTDDFDGETKSLRGKYDDQKAGGRWMDRNDTDEVTGGISLLPYLMKNAREGTDDSLKNLTLYNDITRTYRLRLDEVFRIVNAGDREPDVYALAEQRLSETVETAKKALPGFLPFSSVVRDNTETPRMVIGDNQDKINHLISAFHDLAHNFTDFRTGQRHVVQIAGIDGTIVFFNERGGFEPLRDAVYAGDWKRELDDGYARKGKEMKKETWLQSRRAHHLPSDLDDRAASTKPDPWPKAISSPQPTGKAPTTSADNPPLSTQAPAAEGPAQFGKREASGDDARETEGIPRMDGHENERGTTS